MMILRLAAIAWLFTTTGALAEALKVATVSRTPFSFVENDTDTGFSVDLWNALAAEIGAETEFVRTESFGDMLTLVQNGQVDAAIANISITASREEVLDFSQPMFASGLQIMVPRDSGQASLFNAIWSRDLLLAVLLAVGLLFGGGLLMWRFERHAQPYFQGTAREAAFPAFWWALNLVVNGGFEERMPRTPAGRVFGVMLVFASLFLVSVFVAKITAVMTVDAIRSNIEGVSDLYGKRVATIQNSTADSFLTNNSFAPIRYNDLQSLIDAFETGAADAVVFDAPILAYYTHAQSNGAAELAGNVFLPENYGIAFPSNSALTEEIDRALLRLRENGTYDNLYSRWFGANFR